MDNTIKPSAADLFGLRVPGTEEDKRAAKAIEAIRKAEEADPELRRRRQRVAEHDNALLARLRGKNPYEREKVAAELDKLDRQEKLLHDVRDYLESYPRDTHSRKARLIVTRRIWDEFIPKHKDRDAFSLGFRDLYAAIWTEGYSSLEERAKAGWNELANTGARPALSGTEGGGGDPVKSSGKGLPRGPKPDNEGAARVAEIVERVAPARDWKDRLDEVCKALDTEEIHYPKTWPRRDIPLNSWEDGATLEATLAKKAIEYRLDVAKQRKKAPPETLS
jgi:hypothetical protein